MANNLVTKNSIKTASKRDDNCSQDPTGNKSKEREKERERSWDFGAEQQLTNFSRYLNGLSYSSVFPITGTLPNMSVINSPTEIVILSLRRLVRYKIKHSLNPLICLLYLLLSNTKTVQGMIRQILKGSLILQCELPSFL
jgi:hypothetical protein